MLVSSATRQVWEVCPVAGTAALLTPALVWLCMFVFGGEVLSLCSAFSPLFLSPPLPPFSFLFCTLGVRQSSCWIVAILMKQWIEEVAFCSASLVEQLLFAPSISSASVSPFPLCLEDVFQDKDILSACSALAMRPHFT